MNPTTPDPKEEQRLTKKRARAKAHYDRLKADPERWRKHQDDRREAEKRRRHEDPEHRKKQNHKASQRLAKRKAPGGDLREKYLAYQREYGKKYRARKKAEKTKPGE